MDPRSRPAHVGWNFYRSSGFAASLERINEYLVDESLQPISERMYTHYQRLVRHGFEQYITINQFDVQQLRNPVWSSAIRYRYRHRDFGLPLSLRLVGRPEEIEGVAVSASESWIEATVDAQAVTIKDEGKSGVVTVDGQRVGATVELVIPPADHTSLTRVELSVMGQLDIADMAHATVLLQSTLRIKLDRWDSLTLAETVRSMYLVYQVVDAARLVCDAALAERSGTRDVELGIPTATELARRNPVEIVIAGSIPVLTVAYAALRMWNSVRTSEAGVRLSDANAEVVTAQADVLREAARERRLTNDLRERIVTVASETDLSALARRVIAQSVGQLDGRATALGSGDDRVGALVDDELMPSVTELFEADIRSLEVESSDPPDPAAEE